jgi:hypothetical protein
MRRFSASAFRLFALIALLITMVATALAGEPPGSTKPSFMAPVTLLGPNGACVYMPTSKIRITDSLSLESYMSFEDRATITVYRNQEPEPEPSRFGVLAMYDWDTKRVQPGITYRLTDIKGTFLGDVELSAVGGVEQSIAFGTLLVKNIKAGLNLTLHIGAGLLGKIGQRMTPAFVFGATVLRL